MVMRTKGISYKRGELKIKEKAFFMQLRYMVCVLMLSNVLPIKTAEAYSEALTVFTKRSILYV